MEDVLNEFPISPTLLRVVRVFRLGRVLRLVKVSYTSIIFHSLTIIDPNRYAVNCQAEITLNRLLFTYEFKFIN